MSRNPELAVVMATHNDSKTVEQATRSILSQTFDDFVFFVVDDGSSDGTLQVLEKLRQQDERLVILPRPHRGLTRSLIEAIQFVRSPFVARMDADDVARPTRLQRQVDNLKRKEACVCCGTWAIQIDRWGLPFAPWQTPVDHEAIDGLHMQGVGGGIIHPTAMFRREAYEAVGGYDQRWQYAQDYDLWLRLGEVGRLENIASPLLGYRRSTTAITQAKLNEQLDSVDQIYSAALERRGKGPAPGKGRASQRPTKHSFTFRNIRESSRRHGYWHTYALYATASIACHPLKWIRR